MQPLDDAAMTSVLEEQAPSLSAAERQRIISMSFGSAGRALAFAELELAKLEDAALAILKQGDPTNARRSELALELGKKASAERYAAFLELAPSLRPCPGPKLRAHGKMATSLVVLLFAANGSCRCRGRLGLKLADGVKSGGEVVDFHVY